MAARCSSFTACRHFSTTRPSPSNTTRLHNYYDHMPKYPYPPSQTYRQSNYGLYGGVHIQFGNKVSEKEENKTRRKWSPNVQYKRLWSVSLQRWIRTRVTMRALRTIDKSGGLDEYLLGEKTARIKELGPWGWKLRWRIMQTESIKKRFAEQRRQLGLPEKDSLGLVSSEGNPVDSMRLNEEIRAYDQELDEVDAQAARDEVDEKIAPASMADPVQTQPSAAR